MTGDWLIKGQFPPGIGTQLAQEAWAQSNERLTPEEWQIRDIQCENICRDRWGDKFDVMVGHARNFLETLPKEAQDYIFKSGILTRPTVAVQFTEHAARLAGRR